MKRFVSTIGFVLAMMPSVSHAETTMTWDFRKSETVMPLVEGLSTVEKTPEGLRILTSQDGFIGWQNPPLPRTDAIHLYVKNAKSVEAVFMWQPKGAADGNLLQLFFASPKTDTFEKVSIAPSDYPQWTEKTPVVALGFPAGTDIVIQRIEWKSWNPLEKSIAAMRSFWTFDTMSQYSINFLWGPIMHTDPHASETLFDEMPPKGVSGMRAVYVILFLACIIAGIFLLMERKRRAAMAIIGTVIALWLVLDIRMGVELLSYAVRDIRSYVLPSTKELRRLTDAPQLTDRALELLKDKETDSIVLAEPANVYVANVRLRAYPLNVTSYSDIMRKNPKSAWLVIKRPDITVKDGFVMDANGKALSTKGSLLEQLNDDSFLFLEE